MSDATMNGELTDFLNDVEEEVISTKKEELSPPEATPEASPAAPPPVPQEPTQRPTLRQVATLLAGKDFLKKVIEGEENGEYTKKLIQQLDMAINAPLKEDKTLYRQKLMATYWNFLSGIIEKITSKLSKEKLLCIRYGIVDISLLRPNQSQVMRNIPMDTLNADYPFYYMDEWLQNVADGKIKPSMMDETLIKKTDTTKLQEKLDRKLDSRAASLNILKSKAAERDLIEKSLQSSVHSLINHTALPQFDNVADIYMPEQKEIMNKFSDDIKKLKNLDNYMLSYIRELKNMDTDIENWRNKIGAGDGSLVDSKIIINESNSLRQMVKMCTGPRGNHFPILISDYCPSSLEYINTRENVIKLIKDIEKRDEGAFYREFKGQRNRIVPFILLLPGYGEKGICWEPFDIKQRATSRGRIALPLYPRNPMLALLYAIADLRWQVAKEKASYHWMEEGITGKYYNYFTENKLKGNIKDEFIRDYIIWILQEWNGTQKLEKEVRTIFWRDIPFPQSKKDELRNRGFFYNDLYKKDATRAMSDGY